MCHCAYGRMAEWRKATCIKRVMAGKEGGGGERSETLLCAREQGAGLCVCVCVRVWVCVCLQSLCC